LLFFKARRLPPEFDTKSSFTPVHFNKIKHLQLIF
jgi:hypothetical protein